MAYEPQSRPRRGTNDLMHRESTSRMEDKEEEYMPQPSESHGGGRTHISSSVQDTYKEDRRPARLPSPPMREGSISTSMEQQPASVANLPPELIAQLKEQITNEVIEKLKQTSNIETKANQPSAEPARISDPVDIHSKSEPMASASSTDKSCSTPSPTLSTHRVYTPPSPNSGSRRATIIEDSPPLSPTRSIPSSPTKPSVRFTNSRGLVDKDGVRNARPAAYRSFSNTELSTIDQKWGRLFESDGSPTARLSEFLRGLANHIIEEFEPKSSIVVIPEKMASFYANHSLDVEAHPLVSIFKSGDYEHLSELYQGLNCQHHLVQGETYEKPIAPALTPAGFAHWMTTWIRAYPDQEASRLGKVVISLPIDADGPPVDGRPERLPKQISRHLLPTKEDPESKKVLKTAISYFLEDLGKSTKRKASITSPPPLEQRISSSQSNTRPIDIPQTSSSSKGTEREPMPYASTPTEATISDPVPIERARAPYTAQPGNGKVYTDNLGLPHTTRPGRANSASRATHGTDVEPPPRHIRTQSSASSNPYLPSARPGGAHRGQSPPLHRYSLSTPTHLDTSGSYVAEPFSSSSNQGQPYSASSYNPSSRLPGPPSTDSRGERDRDRDRDRPPRRETIDRESSDPRRYDPEAARSTRQRRSTLVDELPRMPMEINNPRDAERYDRLYEDRDRDRDRDRERDRKDIPSQSRPGPVLHQELRPDPRSSGPLGVPDEEYYRNGGVSARRDAGGEYETERGKYYSRR